MTATLAVAAAGTVGLLVGFPVGLPAVGLGVGHSGVWITQFVVGPVDGRVTGMVGKPPPPGLRPPLPQNGIGLLQDGVAEGVAVGLGLGGAAGTWFHFEPVKIGWRNDCTGRLTNCDCAKVFQILAGQ